MTRTQQVFGGTFCCKTMEGVITWKDFVFLDEEGDLTFCGEDGTPIVSIDYCPWCGAKLPEVVPVKGSEP